MIEMKENQKGVDYILTQRSVHVDSLHYIYTGDNV